MNPFKPNLSRLRHLSLVLALLLGAGGLLAAQAGDNANPEQPADSATTGDTADSALPAGDTTAVDPATADPTADSGDLPGFDSSEFFGDTAQEAEEIESAESQAETFLSDEGVRLGGSFKFSLSTGTMYRRDYADWTLEYLFSGGTFDDPSGTNEDIENSSLNLGGSLWFSARPSDSIRFYGKALVDYPFSDLAASLADLEALADNDPLTVPTGQGIAVPNLAIWELFADFNIDSKVFFRAGKQMVKWGVGYFFQPADIVSLTAVDVNDPTAEREGPLAVKANIPLDIHNLDFYAIVPSGATMDSITDLGLAGRFRFVLADWEFGLGALYQQDQDWNFTATASGSIWEFNFFAEALVNRLSAGNYLADGATTVNLTVPNPVTPDPTDTMVVPTAVDHTLVTDRTDWFFSGTTGLIYNNADAYLNIIGQYYFNGEGYDNPSAVVADALTYVAAGQMTLADLFGNLGRHYAAGFVSWSFVKDSPVSVSLLWLGNLSDGSGFFKPSASFEITDEINLAVSPYFAYGPENSQYRGIAPSLMGGSTAALMPVAQLQLTLSLGSGKF